MYKVTAYFRNHKVVEKFHDLYDAIDFKDSADANYPKNVTFEKVIDMREWVYECWNSVMDMDKNPLKYIPDTSTRHMVLQILAWMWCMVFSFYLGSFVVFGISAIAHVLLLGAIVVTVATFETAKKKPHAFNFLNGYNSHGRARTYTIWRDEKGNAKKVPLDSGDPGGEHE